MLDETKALEKIKTKLRKLEITIIKKGFWEEIDKQETLERLKIKIGTKKHKK